MVYIYIYSTPRIPPNGETCPRERRSTEKGTRVLDLLEHVGEVVVPMGLGFRVCGSHHSDDSQNIYP